MKKHLLLLIVTVFASVTILYSQTPNWSWAKSGIGAEYDQSSAVATDASGNVFVTGYFASDNIQLGSITLNNNTIGFDDAFIAKYDSSGNIVWAQSFGGTSDDKGYSLATDNIGNVYLSAVFYSPSITIGPYTFTNAGNVGDILVVKFSSSGTILWATKEGGPGLEIPYCIAVDDLKNIIVTGRFSSNSITFGTTTLSQAGSMDVFIVKYDSTGNVLWAKGAGGGSNDEPYSIKTDASGNIYVGGYFNQNAIFGTITLSTAGIADAFLAKYDSEGNILWAKSAGGNGDDRTTALSVDNSGNCYISGYFTNDSISFGTIVLPDAPGTNSFVAKYDSSGNVLWAKGVGNNSKATGIALAGDNVLACGYFREDTLNFGSSTLQIEGNYDFFILNYDTTGIERLALKQSSGGSGTEYSNTIAADANGNIIIAGYFDSDPITFGPSVLSNTANSFDMFVARIGSITTEIDNNFTDKNFAIYPNPTSGKFTFKSEVIFDKIEVYDISGKIVYTSKDNQNNFSGELYIQPLASGLYFVKAGISGKVLVKKLIVQ